MSRQGIDRLFATLRREEPAVVASGFAPAVLEQAKRVKRALIVHRRVLAIASLLSLAAALLVSSWIGHSIAVVPPPSDVFGAPSFAVPPSQP